VEYAAAYWERGHPCPLSADRREKKIEWQTSESDEPPFAGTAGILARNERR
jgi:hypothetical protein